MSNAAMTPGERLLAAATAGNTPVLEEIFLEMLEGGGLGDPKLPAAVGALIDAGRNKQALELGSMAAEPLEASGPAPIAFAVLHHLTRLQPKDVALRERIVAVAPAAFADHPQGTELVQTLRLEGGSNARELAEQLTAATTFRPGDVVRHDGGWGLGQVTEIDPLQLKMRVKFLGDAARSFPILTAGEFLTRLEPGSFDHRAVSDPKSLKALGKEDPAELVRTVLRARDNRTSLREIKSALVECKAVSASGWTKFWQAARKVLVPDPFVDVGTGANGIVELRDAPVGRDLELLREIQAAKDLPARLKAIRAALRDPAGAAAAEGFVRELQAEARGLAEDDAGGRVAISLVLEELQAIGAPVEPGTSPEDLATLSERPQHAARALATLRESQDRATVVARLQAQAPERWPAIVSAVLEHDAVDGAYDDAMRAVTASDPDTFRAAAATAVSAARAQPIPALWVCGAVLRGDLDAGAPLPEPADLLRRAMAEMTRAAADAEMAKDRTARTAMRRGRAELPAKTILRFLQEQTDDEVTRLAPFVLRCQALSPKMRADIERWISQHHPHLFHVEESADDTIWVSPAGLAKREAEFTKLMNVDFPENARDLGEAIAKGDLSENAEYEAARQRQQWLVARAEEMKAQLEKAAAIDLAGVPADTVAPGSRVTVADADGARTEYQILGPWDVDVDQGIISYLSPLGQALLGKRAGTAVVADLPDGHVELRLEAVAPLTEFPVAAPENAARHEITNRS